MESTPYGIQAGSSSSPSTHGPTCRRGVACASSPDSSIIWPTDPTRCFVAAPSSTQGSTWYCVWRSGWVSRHPPQYILRRAMLRERISRCPETSQDEKQVHAQHVVHGDRSVGRGLAVRTRRRTGQMHMQRAISSLGLEVFPETAAASDEIDRHWPPAAELTASIDQRRRCGRVHAYSTWCLRVCHSLGIEWTGTSNGRHMVRRHSEVSSLMCRIL